MKKVIVYYVNKTLVQNSSLGRRNFPIPRNSETFMYKLDYLPCLLIHPISSLLLRLLPHSWIGPLGNSCITVSPCINLKISRFRVSEILTSFLLYTRTIKKVGRVGQFNESPNSMRVNLFFLKTIVIYHTNFATF